MTAKGDFFPMRTNDYVPNMNYAADVRKGGFGRVRIPAPPAANATGILNLQSIATAGVATVFATTYADKNMAKFGRNVTVVASGAATSNVTVRGKDYIGQPMSESFTLNGTTPVVGKKAFGRVDRVEFAATAATTINVGWGNVLGLPYMLLDNKAVSEQVSDAPPTAGTFVAGILTAQTLTTGDPRGTYTPNGAVVPDGVRVYDLFLQFNPKNLLGPAQFYA